MKAKLDEALMAIRMAERGMKDCPACEGSGKVEVCAMGHGSANCPCPTRRRPCWECDGGGEVHLTDAELEAGGQ